MSSVSEDIKPVGGGPVKFINVFEVPVGHKTAAITLDTYSHFVPAKGREAADRIAAILG